MFKVGDCVTIRPEWMPRDYLIETKWIQKQIGAILTISEVKIGKCGGQLVGVVECANPEPLWYAKRFELVKDGEE